MRNLMAALAALTFIAFSPQVMEAAVTAANVFASAVLPALFPYLVLSRLLAQTASGGVLAVPVAMLAGSPAGARLLALSERGADAQRKAALCATASPLFLLGTLEGGAKMVAAHWLGWKKAALPAACPTAKPRTRCAGRP